MKCLECNKELKGKHQIYFCSHSCSATYNNRRRKVIYYCLNCGKEVNNLYCSTQCQKRYENRKYIERWKIGKETGNVGINWIVLSATVRNYLLEKTKYKCSQCGWGEINPTTKRIPLEIDHIDGDFLNSSLENLRVLCPNCHSLTSTYRALNKRKDNRRSSGAR